MAHPAASDSSESKLECKDFSIDIQGKGTCQIEKMVCHAASTSDSTENKLERKELHIDISVTCPIKKTATEIIHDIRTSNAIHIPQGWEPARWPEISCIYKVPRKLRDVNDKAYNPKLISIGPLHHGQEELKDMELQKLKYFEEFFKRTRTEKITPNDLASIIETKEENIRHCYTSKFESKEFINMILLDAIFIMELFLRNVTWPKQELLKEGLSKHPIYDLVASEQRNLVLNKDASDYMFSEKWLSYNLKQELLLLENQLPFFILEELWDKTNCYEGDGKTSFLTLAFAYFYEFHPEHEKKQSSRKEKNLIDMLIGRDPRKEVKDVKQHFTGFKEYIDKSGKKVKHFTDMIRYFFYIPKSEELSFTENFRKRFRSKDESENGGSIKHLYSATQLDEAGVKFKGVGNRPLLDIKFSKNPCLECCPFLNFSWLLNCLPCFTCFKIMQPFLEVPTFEVNDETECVFRNLMAYEQCHSQSDLYICNYILLLDRFINSKEDVDLLVDEKVIVNFLGSNKKVATLVNQLCLEIVEPDHSPYNDLSERLKKHYNNLWNKNMASLTRLYFGDFWRGIATVVGLTVLIFTLWNYDRLLFK